MNRKKEKKENIYKDKWKQLLREKRKRAKYKKSTPNHIMVSVKFISCFLVIFQSQKDIERHHAVSMDFRKFYLPLVAHQSQRAAYFSHTYDTEYGQDFRKAIGKLCDKFISTIFSQLPDTTIEKVNYTIKCQGSTPQLYEGECERMHSLISKCTEMCSFNNWKCTP